MSSFDATLADVTSRVLEELCFHFVGEPADAVEPMDRVWAKVAFRGKWPGAMSIGVQRALLAELAATLLGEDSATEDDAAQALLEIANVICGHALPEIESDQARFELDSPVLVEPLGADESAYAAANLDDGKVLVRLERQAA